MTNNQLGVTDRETRYRVVDHTGLTVEVQDADGDVDAFDAELLDISTGGAMLKVSRSLRDNNNHSVKITSNDLNGPIYVDVQVCSSRLKATGDWSIGCSFHPSIPNNVLAGLTSAGIIDRRENHRDSTSIDAMAQWELEAEQAPVRIVDISKEGFCLASNRSGLPGSRVLLRLETKSQDMVMVTAHIRWQIGEEHGYTIGCEVAHEFRSVLRKMLNTSADTKTQSVWKRLLART